MHLLMRTSQRWWNWLLYWKQIIVTAANFSEDFESATLLLTSVTEPLLTDAGHGGGVINHITASLGSYVNERNR